MAVLESIKNILSENLDVNPDEVGDDTTFDEMGIDSLDMAELISTLEDELCIDFGQPEGLETIGALVEYVESLQA